MIVLERAESIIAAQLTGDGSNQELCFGWTVLQLEGHESSLTTPGDVEWDANSDTAVVRVGKGDKCLSKGEAGEDKKGLWEEHLEDWGFRRRSVEFLNECGG